LLTGSLGVVGVGRAEAEAARPAGFELASAAGDSSRWG